MSLFAGILSVKGITYLMFGLFVIASLGYLLGRITVNGVSLGTAGVFIVALLFGCFFYSFLEGQTKGYTASALKIIENLGLILFVTSVGFIAGPNFFSNLKRNFKSYILLGVLIILVGGLSCAACIAFDIKAFGSDSQEAAAMLVGTALWGIGATCVDGAEEALAGHGEGDRGRERRRGPP